MPFPECYLKVNARLMTEKQKSRPSDVCRSHLTAGWLRMMEATSPQGSFIWKRRVSSLIGMYIIALHALQNSSIRKLLPREDFVIPSFGVHLDDVTSKASYVPTAVT